MAILPTVIYIFNTIPIKIPADYFEETYKLIQTNMEMNRAQNSQSFVKNRGGGLTLCNSKTHYKSTVMKTMWHWPRDRYVGQWSKAESRNKPLTL